MTRELKIGMAVATSFLSLVGVVVGIKLYNRDIPPPDENIVASLEGGPKQTDSTRTSGAENTPNILPIGASSTAKDLTGQPPGSPPPPVMPELNNLGITIPSPPLGVAGSNLPNPTSVAPNDDITKFLEAETKKEQDRLRAGAPGQVNNGFATFEDPKTVAPSNNTLPTGPQSLPTFPRNGPDPDKWGPDPVPVAQQIIDRGGKKQAAPAELPPLPPPQSPNGINNPPVAFEGTKETITGGKPAAPNPLQFNPIKKDSGPLPANIAKDPPPPVGVNPVPPLANPFAPNPLPPPNADKKADIQPNPFALNPLPSPNADKKSDIQTPPQTILAPGKPMDIATLPPPVGPTPSTPINPPFRDTIPTPPNGDFVPAPVGPQAQAVPLVKTETPREHICEFNENFASIAARMYPGTGMKFAAALEEYNRDFTTLPALRDRPARLQAGMKVLAPSQEYLLERYAGFVPGALQGIPAIASPMTNNRTGGNDIGLNLPFPSTKLPAAPAPAAAAGVTTFTITGDNVYLSQVAQQRLGSALRWIDIYRLNPTLQPEQPLRAGTQIRMPTK